MWRYFHKSLQLCTPRLAWILLCNLWWIFSSLITMVSLSSFSVSDWTYLRRQTGRTWDVRLDVPETLAGRHTAPWQRHKLQQLAESSPESWKSLSSHYVINWKYDMVGRNCSNDCVCNWATEITTFSMVQTNIIFCTE